MRALNHKYVQGIGVDERTTGRYFLNSGSLATMVTPIIGYARAAELTKRAEDERKVVRDLILDEGVLTEEQLNTLMEHSTMPNLEVVGKIRKKKNITLILTIHSFISLSDYKLLISIRK